ncbi:MAG TPA: histidine kinase [Catalimonadaceae bacterium]|nr:histidine kinase [Catalimonadaceae bacterium]
MRPVAIDIKPFQPKDGLARLIGIPVLAVLMHLWLNPASKSFWTNDSLKGLFMAFLYTLAYWEGIRIIWCKLQIRYGHYSQTKRRLLALLGIVLLYGIAVTIGLELTHAMLAGKMCTTQKLIWGYFGGMVPTFLVLMTYESVYFFESWKQKVEEAEAFARVHLQRQLVAQQNQLDPHFLFNSLNTLSSLINENEPAQNYLSRLSDVYRYVLMSKDLDTVSLKEELAFVSDFLYLAKVRFQEGLNVQMVIPESTLSQSVAPLSVQLLVENALKHNVVTRENPLTIRIEISDQYLWVKNEIRPKVHFESSTKVGLKNILEQYKLLTLKPVQIINKENIFEVAIPLL